MPWVISRGISVRKAGQELGFEIEYLPTFQKKQQRKLRQKIILSIVRMLDEEWSEKIDGRLRDVRQGVYVLCLDDGLCVNYSSGLSRVLYIGKGAIRGRISNHLDKKLLDFFLQLPGMRFRFYLREAKRKKLANYFECFESDLIREFQDRYGERPLFNKNAGKKHRAKYKKEADWKTPLKNVRANYSWAISSAQSRAKSPTLDS